MTEEYLTQCFEEEPQWEKVPTGKLEFWNWETDNPYRPETSFQMCFVKNSGVYLKMKTSETELRTVCKKRDENCWEDSCMEFFFAPFELSDGYINFEMTPSGAFLSAFGKGRENRVFLKSITSISPSLLAKTDSYGWALELFVPCALIEDVFKREFTASPGNCFGNFFKCGDLTKRPHYGSFSPMGQLPPGFHNPELFVKITVKDGLKND